MVKFVVIDGNIGVGKTHTLQFLADELSKNYMVKILNEPIDIWQTYFGKDLLNDFYTKNINFETFQNIVLFSHYHNISNIRNEYKNYDFVLLERHAATGINVFSEVLKNNNKISDRELEMLKCMFKLMFNNTLDIAQYVNPDFIILLDCNTKLCLKRIQFRNRASEKTIQIDYLDKLRDQYIKWMFDRFYPLMPEKIIYKSTDTTDTMDNNYIFDIVSKLTIKQPKIVIFEGNIHVGKSRVINELTKYYETKNKAVYKVLEPIDFIFECFPKEERFSKECIPKQDSECLINYYKNEDKSQKFEFQLLYLYKSYQKLNELLEKDMTKYDYIFIERTFLSCEIFTNVCSIHNNMTESQNTHFACDDNYCIDFEGRRIINQFIDYYKLSFDFKRLFEFYDTKVIHVKCPFETCIDERFEYNEYINESYLKNLQDYYYKHIKNIYRDIDIYDIDNVGNIDNTLLKIKECINNNSTKTPKITR